MTNFLANNILKRMHVGAAAVITTFTGNTLDLSVDQPKVVVHEFTLSAPSAATVAFTAAVNYSTDNSTWTQVPGSLLTVSNTATVSSSTGINLMKYAIEIISPRSQYQQLVIAVAAGPTVSLCDYTVIEKDLRTGPQPASGIGTNANFQGVTVEAG